MSWIFGAISENLSSQIKDQFKAIHSKPLTSIDSLGFYLAAGGIEETCLYGTLNPMEAEEKEGWLMVGIGLKRAGDHAMVFSKNDWNSILNSPNPNLSIDGHFVAVKWQDGKMQCYTDQLGMRTLYIVKDKDTIMFSTRLDWLAKSRSGNTLNWFAVGSRWLMLNQLNYDCLLEDIDCLGPSGEATIEATSYSFKSKPWNPNSFAATRQNLESILQPLLFPQKEDFDITLGLSGGLDSRVLLALYAAKRHMINLHVFGHPDDPDVRVSRQIAHKENLAQDYYHSPIPNLEDLLAELPNYIGQTCLAEPASSILKLRYYPEIHSKRKILLDGGFGEIARCHSFVRLSMLGKKEVQNGDPKKIYWYLSLHHASIFKKEVLDEMMQGVENQIEDLWLAMPKASEIGFENFIDLFAIRTRFPNYGGFEQSRMDAQIMSYMPYIQPSFLNEVFQTPVRLRRNGKLFKQLIRQKWPSLSKYPLVKSGLTYPFYLGNIPALLWTKLKSKLRAGYKNHLQSEFLTKMSDHLQDIVRSAEVKSFPAYNHNAIIRLADQYYKGKTELASQLEWFLTFEIWRRSLNAK